MPGAHASLRHILAPFLDTFGPSDYFMAVLEAMASGKAVVVSNVGGMPEVVSDEVGRLVNPHDVESIASGMRELLADRDLRACVREPTHERMSSTIVDPAAIVKHSTKTVYRRFTQ